MPIDLSPWLGLRAAGLATAISLAFGVWLAWALVNRPFSGRRTVGTLVSLALALPAPVVCTYLFWTFTLPHVVAAGVLSAAPVLVRFARSAFAGLDPGYGKAARSLGASEWRVFARVDVPLAAGPILAGAGLAFTRVAAELAVAGYLASR